MPSVDEPWRPAIVADPSAACAWCGSPIGSTGRWAAGRVTCPDCGVATTWPVPSDGQLALAYGDWYRPGAGRFGRVGDELLRRLRSTTAVRVDRLAPPGPVLDVGAGNGDLVRALQRRGREAVGIEAAASGADVVVTPIEELGGRWAAVVFWHSLEHLRRPVDALRAAHEALVPGGLLVVALPDAASTQAGVLGDRWLALDLPRHLVHVPGPRLAETVRDLGFTVERVSAVAGGQSMFGWLHGLVGRVTGHDLYDAIRAPEARQVSLSGLTRAVTLATGAVLGPVALALAGIEAARSRGGSTYLEARR